MNKTFRISSGIVTVLILVLFFVAGCRGGKKAPQEEIPVRTEDNAEILQDIKQAEKIFQALPSPIESAMLVKSAGGRFDESLLNPVGNVSTYVTNK
ncbi:MAG: hypothetical protein IQL11_05200, partial [Bacteroidales bacterium]|nr:hypothetical protein [Bacteroidales bacterium]